MRVIDFLVKLEEQNLTRVLTNRGILSYKCYTYREYYQVFCAIRDTAPEFDRKKSKTWCVAQAAVHCKTSVNTIWAAISEMEAEIPD